MSQGRKIEMVVCAAERVVYKVGEPVIYVLEDGSEHTSKDTPKVKEVGQHEPMGPGDCWFCLVMFEDGSQVQVFNVDRVMLSKPMAIMPVTSKLIA